MSIYSFIKEAIKLIVSLALALALGLNGGEVCENTFHSESGKSSVKLHHFRVGIITA